MGKYLRSTLLKTWANIFFLPPYIPANILIRNVQRLEEFNNRNSGKYHYTSNKNLKVFLLATAASYAASTLWNKPRDVVILLIRGQLRKRNLSLVIDRNGIMLALVGTQISLMQYRKKRRFKEGRTPKPQ